MCHWSDFYDSVFEHPECPSQAILEDDSALDSWVREQAKKAEARRANTNRKGKGKRALDHQEVIIF